MKQLQKLKMRADAARDQMWAELRTHQDKMAGVLLRNEAPPDWLFGMVFAGVLAELDFREADAITPSTDSGKD